MSESGFFVHDELGVLVIPSLDSGQTNSTRECSPCFNWLSLQWIAAISTGYVGDSSLFVKCLAAAMMDSAVDNNLYDDMLMKAIQEVESN